MALELVPFEEYARQFDLERIAQAVVDYRDGEPKLSSEDFSDIKRMVWETGEQWLPRDMHDLQITEIETEHHMALTNCSNSVKMLIDLEGVTRGSIPTFNNFAGGRVLFDWKTRDGSLDTAWKDRQVGSWQWKLYTRAREASLFVYRGVSRQINIPRWEKFREVIIVPPIGLQDRVDTYLRGKIAQRQSLVQAGLKVWPQSMPSACNAFNRECPCWDDCVNYTMPQYVPKEDKVMSYTYLSRFGLCPEKARRLEQEEGLDDSEDSWFGVAFHRGMADMYKQAKELQLS